LDAANPNEEQPREPESIPTVPDPVETPPTARPARTTRAGRVQKPPGWLGDYVPE
jgi:hypothetical protein